jgi:four helix bundle protein
MDAVWEEEKKYFIKGDLRDRLFQFAVDVILALRTLPKSSENSVISYQLIKSSSSSSANYEESQGAVSKADFTNKVGISLKEMRESNFWIRLLIATGDSNEPWPTLENESEELKKILGSIYSKTSIRR